MKMLLLLAALLALPELGVRAEDITLLLTNGTSITGRIVETIPAAVRISVLGPNGPEIKTVLVESLRGRTQTNLPPELSAPYVRMLQVLVSARDSLVVISNRWADANSCLTALSNMVAQMHPQSNAQPVLPLDLSALYGVKPDAVQKEFGEFSESFGQAATIKSEFGTLRFGFTSVARLRFFSISFAVPKTLDDTKNILSTTGFSSVMKSKALTVGDTVGWFSSAGKVSQIFADKTADGKISKVAVYFRIGDDEIVAPP